MSCDAFVNPILFSSISNGKGKFPTTPIKVANLTETVERTVDISLVIPETNNKKTMVNKVIKNLLKFTIKITPSNICQKISIIQKDNATEQSADNFLSLEATAGTSVNNLKVIAFSQNGKQLTDKEFMAQNPHITTTWAEVWEILWLTFFGFQCIAYRKSYIISLFKPIISLKRSSWVTSTLWLVIYFYLTLLRLTKCPPYRFFFI